ncbi:HNH endonuclease [Sedimentitalea todarodis]|uniref:HNH endonuclease n=1 Tax=Sedimentitalea todarodis TaxID=1631240 RepID=A0ABU3VE37_9RHOB|nr:HNH endonuclease [Sedimentitalea todarodis]MDU9004285.1 HNH endonuclease [Sedimentitalea todarodis]
MIRFVDPSTAWYEDILANHAEAAQALVDDVLADTERDGNGCLVTATVEPRKVRFRGSQDRAYRFVHCVTEGLAATPHQVVRHRCHNRRCVNPEHLVIGTRADNLRDEWDRQANGVDFNLL